MKRYRNFRTFPSNGSNLWQAVVEQLDYLASLLQLDPGVHAVLREPKRALEVSIPVKMDDGSLKVFKGYRVHHNLNRGPGKGGIRYHPEVTSLHKSRKGLFFLKVFPGLKIMKKKMLKNLSKIPYDLAAF